MLYVRIGDIWLCVVKREFSNILVGKMSECLAQKGRGVRWRYPKIAADPECAWGMTAAVPSPKDLQAEAG